MGLLTGKYRDGRWPAEARLAKFPDFGERYKRPRVLEAAREYCKVAERHGLPLTGIALAYVRSRFFVASTIIGATSIAQLEELAKFFALELPGAVIADLEVVNAVYPSPSAQ
jgi:aryl-alcohol dehydrogenase (NADP+)